MKKVLKGMVSLLSVFVLCSCNLNNSTNKSSNTSTPATSEVDSSSPSNPSPTPASSQSSSSSGSTEADVYSKITPNYDMSDYAKAAGYDYTQSKGNINLLAIPLVITDYEANATDAVKQDIEKALFGTSNQTGWESLSSFYKTSSNNQLNFTGSVSNWYNPGLSITAMEAKYKADGYSYVSELVENAITWYKTEYDTDMTDFDNDHDGYIDGVFLVYSAPDYTKGPKDAGGTPTLSDLFWAFAYWDFTEPNLASPNPFTYFWCSYDFIYDEYGETEVDSHTFCHETGHMLGLDDYYSYDENVSFSPVAKLAMMDNNVTDHDCYSKFALGWTTPYLVDKEGTLTISLDESVVIPAKGSTVKNAFDEYVMLEIFGPNGLNKQDLTEGYSSNNIPENIITRDGIRAYHVDSRLLYYVNGADGNPEIKGYISDPTEYTKHSDRSYAVAHSNSIDRSLYNTEYRLIQLISNKGTDYSSTMACMDDNDLFHAGDKFDNSAEKFTKQFYNETSLNNGSELAYDFEVVSISDGKATLRFTAN